MLSLLFSAVLFVCIDFIYLYSIKDYFNKQIKNIQGSPIKPNLLGIVVTYAALIFGINYFIISQKRSIWDAFLLGIVIYAVYEFTNLALFKNWRILTTIMDTTWGGILFALTTFIVYGFKYKL